MTLSNNDRRAAVSSSLLGRRVSIPSSSVTILMESSGNGMLLDGLGMKPITKSTHWLKVSSNLDLIWWERMQSSRLRTLCNGDFRYMGMSSVKKLKVSASLSVTSAITKVLQSLCSSAWTRSRWCSMWVMNSESSNSRASGFTRFLWPPLGLVRAGSSSVVFTPRTVSRSWWCLTWSRYRSHICRVIVRTFSQLVEYPSISSAISHACLSSWLKSTRPLWGTGSGRNFWMTSVKWLPSSM
mmetsp:Transcript_32995/g.98054  ORF Transcript_32995/g.98054 Transcript_32995/m.98054 type:complete len:240 (-) Transcript_32995:749-1468(-)